MYSIHTSRDGIAKYIIIITLFYVFVIAKVINLDIIHDISYRL